LSAQGTYKKTAAPHSAEVTRPTYLHTDERSAARRCVAAEARKVRGGHRIDGDDEIEQSNAYGQLIDIPTAMGAAGKGQGAGG
jgi:hypothetical protein